jgi:hypothetical protein
VGGSPALADTTSPAGTPNPATTCAVGLELQPKLAIGSLAPQYGARVTGGTGCFFLATWDLANGIYSTGQVVTFFSPNTSGYLTYLGGPATVHGIPRQGASSLQQVVDPLTGQRSTLTVVETGSRPMVVKYDSRIAWHRATRAGGILTLKASVAQYSRSAAAFGGGYVAWPKAKVRFQVRSAGAWRTVATVRANSKGLAVAHLKRGVHTWRAVSVTTGSVWGKATKSHRG